MSSPQSANPGPGGVFATTQWSVVLAAGASSMSAAAEPLERLCQTYWPAVYAVARRYGYDPEAAQDITQGFFAKLLEKRWIADADREKGRFRTFLITALKRFIADEHDRARALKRGGRETLFSFDALEAEQWYALEPRDNCSPEILFDRRWALTVLAHALARLEEEQQRSGTGEVFGALKDHLAGRGDDNTIIDVGHRFGLMPSAVKMRLFRLRQRFRELVRAEIAETLSDRSAIDEELRSLKEALR